MSVITFSREPCSEGTLIAESTAKKLGYRLAGKKTIEEVLLQYVLVGFEAAYDSLPNFWTRFDDETTRMVQMFDRVVLAMARLGDVVIMGRGAFRVLAPYKNVLHVRIKSPFSYRLTTYMYRYNIFDEKKAKSALLEADRLRASYLEMHYGIRHDSSEYFDLVIDTSKIPPHTAVPFIIKAVETIGDVQDGKKPSTDSIEVDDILLEATRRVLDEQP